MRARSPVPGALFAFMSAGAFAQTLPAPSSCVLLAWDDRSLDDGGYARVARAAKHDTILTAGLRVDIPFSGSVSRPISLTYASHADLLTNQKLVTGTGLASDFSGLSKKKPQ
jgi:hypothetical protein